MPQEKITIKNINEFKLKNNFKLNIDHDLLLQDVNMLYLTQNYKNIDSLLFDDFTRHIISIIEELYESVTEDFTEKFETFMEKICEKILEKIKTYLDLNIFPNIMVSKQKHKKKKLTEEEQKVVKLIQEKSGNNAVEMLNSRKFKMLLG